MIWLTLAILIQKTTSVWFKDTFLVPSSTCGLIPPGHLYPFGYHKQPLSAMDIIPNNISTEEFDELYIKPKGYRPGVFRGIQKHTNSVLKWSDEYLGEKFGDYKVLTEVKHEQRQKFGKSLNTLSKFLKEYNTTNQYVVTVLPDEMRHEVHMPPFLQCGTYSHNLLELNLWMGSGDTASQVHYDADHNIHCLLAGKKSFFMIHPDQYHKMYMERLEHTGSNYCPNINQNRVDMLEQSSIADVDYQWDMLYPGDCIFIPAQYTHQVRSYGRSISVTILWDPTVQFDISSLVNCLPNNLSSIADNHVVWNHKMGDIFLDVGYATPHIMRKEVGQVWAEWTHRLHQEGADSPEGWSYNEFISLMFDLKRWHLPECTYTRSWVALIAHGLDTDHSLLISPAEIESSSDQLMKAVSHFVDAPNLNDEIYNFCQTQFFYIPPEVVTKEEMEEIKAVGTEKWLQQKGYQSSKNFSELFFDFLKYVRDKIHGQSEDDEGDDEDDDDNDED
ncbi:uncharacterized protein LOC134816848 isoform X2 [Bolinopsis microptera]|uniref:uncharacterized protein LOC134816848 isoform X1 n=1 Tax=Bolinopsis microptera TaxID=2820187 RepID=UPI00307A977C